MAYSIIWSDFAESELDKIYEYYCKNAGTSVASEILSDIISEANRLLIDPFTYPLEEALLDWEIQYRYFICGSYKLIYSVDKNLKQIKIADVFDTRQDPPKLKRTK